ncbi:hypothetical protein ACLKMH_00635 [Psychromonas sp. KJ10-10]|uniref:hypothetical protein n=1 Tax=Psychromonas sp. KJ10-10 TaxID=3391823 RepID=UPI0039B56DF1
MQKMHRKRNCSRTPVNEDPSAQCKQKQQRIRRCGRVITKDELNNQPLEDFQEKCIQKGKRSRKGQGSGNGHQNSHDKGLGKGRHRQNA